MSILLARYVILLFFCEQDKKNRIALDFEVIGSEELQSELLSATSESLSEGEEEREHDVGLSHARNVDEF